MNFSYKASLNFPLYPQLFNCHHESSRFNAGRQSSGLLMQRLMALHKEVQTHELSTGLSFSQSSVWGRYTHTPPPMAGAEPPRGWRAAASSFPLGVLPSGSPMHGVAAALTASPALCWAIPEQMVLRAYTWSSAQQSQKCILMQSAPKLSLPFPKQELSLMEK